MKREHPKLIALSGELFGALPALSSELKKNRKGKGKEHTPEEREGKGIQGGNPERNHSIAFSSPAAGFDEFWSAYRVKKGKAAALRAWQKHRCAGFAAKIIAAVERLQAEDRAWLEGYQPHPTTWLNAGGWDDEPLPPVKPRHPPTADERKLEAIRRSDELFDRLSGGGAHEPERGQADRERFEHEVSAGLVGGAHDHVRH
jgi:hypothetical protein